MKITFVYDLDEILMGEIGQFGIGYYFFLKSKKSKKKPKNSDERFFLLLYHLFGKLALFYVQVCTRLFYLLLSDEEFEELRARLLDG